MGDLIHWSAHPAWHDANPIGTMQQPRSYHGSIPVARQESSSNDLSNKLDPGFTQLSSMGFFEYQAVCKALRLPLCNH